MSTPILQNLISLLLSLLLALVPLYTVFAQDKPGKLAPGTMRIQMFKSIDGKLVYSKDTVINAADREKELVALKALKLDKKTWKKLEAASILADSGRTKLLLDNPGAVRFKIAMDTARLKDMHIYHHEKSMRDSAHTMLLERLKGFPGDSFRVKAERIVIMHGDSIQVRTFSKEQGKALRKLNATWDSVHTIIRVAGPHGSAFKHGAHMFGEDVTARYSTSDKIKIETDESGKTTVYELDDKGNKKEIDAYHFGRSGEKSTVILLNKTKVEDITRDDKKALKEAGVKVEKSAKKELKLEDLSYYPNPSNGKFNVSFTLQDKGPAIVRILNSAGKEVYQQQVEGTGKQYEKQLNLTGTGKGIYYLQVEQNGRTITKRLLVQ